MAGEDLIFKTLIQAGLRIDEADKERVRRQLAELGRELSDGVELSPLEQQVKELRRLSVDFKRDRRLLEKASTGGIAALSPEEKRQLTQAFNSLKAYQDRLKRVTSTLTSLGDAAGEPLLRDLGSLNKVFARLGAMSSKVAPMVDTITQSYKANVKEAQKLRKEEDIARSRAVRARKERRGRLAVDQAGGLDAPVTGFRDVASARKAQRFLTGELRDLTALQKAHAAAFGDTSDQAKRAGAEVNRYANYLNNLERRIEELNASSVRQNKIDTANQRIRDAEEKRRVESIRQQRGRQVFTQAAGNFQSINDPRDARKALSFVNSELRQLEVQQRETAKAAGTGSEQYKKAAAEVNRYASAVAALQARLDQLTVSADKAGKARTSSRPATGSSIYTDGRQVYQQARLIEGGLQALGTEEAKSAKQFVQARLAEVRSRGKELGKLYGENSREARAAGEAARRYALDLGVLSAAARPAAQGLNFLQVSLRSFFKYAVAYQVLYSLAAAIGALARGVAELQAELLEIQAVTGSTDAQMQTLSTTVLGVAKNSKFSLIELTKAAKVLAQAGVAVEDLNSTLSATANFAAATGSNLEIAADLLSTTRSVFKELSDTVIADQLAKAINVSKLTGDDLKTILSLGAQTAKSFNLTSEQFLAAVSVLRNAGLKASTVATGLRQGLLEIFSPDANLIKALQERYRALGENLGSEAVRARFFAFTRDRAPLIAALTELKRLGFADEGAQTLSRAFDVRSANAIKAMVNNLEELSEVEGRITFGRGAAEGAATVIDGLNASFTRLKSTISGFTYSRSEGILGFLTDVVQGIDRAIQGLDEYDLKQRAKGNKSLGSKILDSVSSVVPAVGALRAATNLYFGPSLEEQQAQEADAQADVQQRLLDRHKAEFAQYEEAAREYDIKAAEVGEAVGQTAESLVRASRTADDLTVGLRDVFGNFGEQQEAIEELVKSYNGLSTTQRQTRLEELKKKFPNSRLAAMSFAEADRALAELGKLRSEISGALAGFAKDLNQKLVRSREIIAKMGDRQPISQEEVEAVVFEQIVSQSSDLQDILRTTSEHAVNLQFGIIQQASQALSDQLRAKGEANPFESEARRQAEAFITRVKAVSLSANQGTADADVRSAVTALLAQFDKLDQASITRLQQIQTAIFDAANQLGSGQGQKLLLYSIAEIQKGVDAKATRVLEETAQRTQANKELIGPALQDPGFRRYLESQPVKTVGQRRIESLTGPDSKGLPVEDVLGNTLAFQETLKAVQDYNDIQKRTNALSTEQEKELRHRLALERAATRATEAFDEARTNKNFSEARSALGAMYGAQVAVEAERLEEANRQLEAIKGSGDIDKVKQATERVILAQNRIGELQEKRGKELEKLNREEAKVSLRREQSTLKGEQKRLRSVLDNATYLTPQEVLNDTIKLYDENNLKLLELFERRQKLEGELNDLSEEQIEEEKKKLRPFADTAEAQELRIRREQGQLDNILLQLNEEPTTGDIVTDARYRERGLIPGSREQRKEFLERRQETLQTALTVGRENLQRNAQELELLRAKAAQDLGNDEITKKLEKAIQYEEALVNGTRNWALELGDVSLALEKVNTRFQIGFQRAFDPQLIRAQLQQSQYSFEQFGDVINDQIVGGIEGIGDAFADAALEGENFLDSMDKLFIDTGKSILRTIIKTFSNEAIGGLLGGMPIFGPAIAKATGTTVPGEGGEEQQGLLGGLLGGLFGGGKKKPAADGLGVGGAEGCCCDDGDKKDPRDISDGTGLKEVTETEGKGFFGTLTGWFGGLIDSISGGFGKMFGSLKGLLFGGGGGGGDGGLVGLATGLFSAFTVGSGASTYKGAFGFARGGVFRGKGSGTSDSIRTYLQGPNGERMPIRVSAGESLLNAKATDMLGADFVHAANSGRLFNQGSGNLAADQAKLTAAIPAAPAGGGSTERVTVAETRNIQVAVSPAQMRMRLGDWLDQQILDEVARR